ncbi:TlpA family protein disulfide reductase [Caloramator sp. Dgby_cultured_2]|uniref:TlpA family protein disulfide reductase n=1 Tax=Caloramator sp. Dgby_cultured_2 TaxID=3029174 RepID=UPI00237E28B0|nr:TlpA disulfide reductase family protein [Caloramator sp. Dgby_cultured_2]WDU82711.1 TlpA disulfide reductase family protein [Caloramator sp. Dgby_cultured_2]
MNRKTILISIIIILIVAIGISFKLYKPQKQTEDNTITNEDTIKTEGNFASDFSLENLNGKTIKLSDYKGKVIVLNFFATWCPPCKAELPRFVKMVDEYKGKDVEFVFVDIGEDNKTVESFLKANSYNIVPLMDFDGNVANIYGVRGIPTTFIIDRNFEIINQHVGYMDEGTLKDLIDSTLNK